MRRISFPHRLENLTCYLVVLVGSLFNWSRYLPYDRCWQGPGTLPRVYNRHANPSLGRHGLQS
jgi:hypothetical protein